MLALASRNLPILAEIPKYQQDTTNYFRISDTSGENSNGLPSHLYWGVREAPLQKAPYLFGQCQQCFLL